MVALTEHTGRRRARALRALVLLLAAAAAPGCALRQHLLTGEPVVFAVDSNSGSVVDRDVLAPDRTAPPGTVPHKGEIIAIVVNNVFLRCLRGLTSPHVLVYAEVFDDGQDDPSTAITKVLFNELDQPSGVNLGLADRLLYGPTPYKGFPIRIKFNIIQLNKEKKELTSKLINAAGSVASTVQPQAAPAVGLVVQIAQLVNELTRDDFELRFDLTLHPVERTGIADVADKTLGTEPVQRVGKPFAAVSTLRTEPYVVIKRELPERFVGCGGELPSSLVYDWTQEAFLNSYVTPDGKPLQTEEILRLQGGYLYWIVRAIWDGDNKALNSATIKPRAGPNRSVEFGIAKGIRQRFTDQTYVTLTVLNGLPMGLDQESLRSSSKRDLEQLSRLLDNPGQAPISERIGARIDDLTASIKTVFEQRRIAETASRRVGRDPAFRTSTEYPAFWTRQAESLQGLSQTTVAFQNAVAKNSAILQSASDLIVNLPVLRADTEADMTWLRGLKASSFESIAGQPGVFRLTAAALGTVPGRSGGR